MYTILFSKKGKIKMNQFMTIYGKNFFFLFFLFLFFLFFFHVYIDLIYYLCYMYQII